MNIQTIPLADLSLDPSNVRKHSRRNLDAIKASLRKFGQQKPIVVDAKGIVLAGNGTLTAAKELGWTEIQIVRTELAGVEATAFAIADNRTAELAEWDEDGLANVLQSLKVEDADLLAATGYDAAEVDKMSKAEVTEDEVPEPPAEPITKAGDLWILGEHRVLCGDSTKAEDVMRLMNGFSADMVFTDPPYNVASESKNFATGVSKAMNDLSKAEWDKGFAIEPALDNIRMVVSKNCTIYIWTSQFLINSIWAHLDGWCDFTNYCVWTKPNPMPSLSKRHWTWATELCVYASIGSKRVVNFPSDGHALNWWSDVKKSDGTHPTQKPIEICKRPILFSSIAGQLVLDLFLGSGTTLIAAEQLGRKCYGMEISPAYCDVIVQRWENLTGKKAVLDKPTT